MLILLNIDFTKLYSTCCLIRWPVSTQWWCQHLRRPCLLTRLVCENQNWCLNANIADFWHFWQGWKWKHWFQGVYAGNRNNWERNYRGKGGKTQQSLLQIYFQLRWAFRMYDRDGSGMFCLLFLLHHLQARYPCVKWSMLWEASTAWVDLIRSELRNLKWYWIE